MALIDIMRILAILKLALLSLALLISASCTTMSSKIGGLVNLDTDVSFDFYVDADVNPDDQNTPSPIVIRMYELKCPKMLEKVNFIDLYEQDAQILGDDMVSKQRLKHLLPGQKRKDKFVLNNETKYIGLFAEFLKYKNSAYKLIIPETQNNMISSSTEIKLSDNRLSFLKQK